MKLKDIEQAMGVEPTEASVAHWPVTTTRLLGGAASRATRDRIRELFVGRTCYEIHRRRLRCVR
jgi:hypothetical protein